MNCMFYVLLSFPISPDSSGKQSGRGTGEAHTKNPHTRVRAFYLLLGGGKISINYLLMEQLK